MITLTYEYKLKPTKQQTEQIDHDLEVCRRVWNYALRERKDWIVSRKCPVNACSLRSEYIIPADVPYPGFKVQCQRLTEAKRLNADLASVKLLQRRLKRKRIGSANWKKAQIKVARLHEQIANTRKDFHFKAAHQICDGADVIVVEDVTYSRR
jgi:transposase